MTHLILPNFIVTGAARAGTTYLFSLLRQHPEIALPGRIEQIASAKDLHFFDCPEAQHSNLNLADYARHFADADGKRAVGEVATSYIYFDWVAGTIARYLGEIKLIFLMRNPIKRAYAHYWHELMIGKETFTFEEAIRFEPARLAQGYTENYRFSYVARGKYMQQIRHYLPYFPRENLLFLFSEDLYEQPGETLAQVCRHLDVDPNFQFDYDVNQHHMPVPIFPSLYRSLRSIHHNFAQRRFGGWRLARLARASYSRLPRSNRPYPPMKHETYEYLRGVFRADVSELSAFLDTDLSTIWFD